jgi:hypothetical protein
MEEALNPFFDHWSSHAWIGEQEVFAGDSPFRPWGAKEKRVQVASHTPETNGFIDSEAEHANPRRQTVENINCGHIHDAALLSEGEGDDFGLRELPGR